MQFAFDNGLFSIAVCFRQPLVFDSRLNPNSLVQDLVSQAYELTLPGPRPLCPRSISRLDDSSMLSLTHPLPACFHRRLLPLFEQD